MPVPVSPDEVRGAALWWTSRNAKARRELGFKPRPHEETLEDSVRWQLEQLNGRVGEPSGMEALLLGVIGRAVRTGERLVRG
jgi:hypothetical protein